MNHYTHILAEDQARLDAAGIKPMADRRAPPDATSIATLIRRLPVFGPEEAKALIVAISSRVDDLIMVGAATVCKHLDYASDACDEMRESTDEEDEQAASDAHQETLLNMRRDSFGDRT